VSLERDRAVVLFIAHGERYPERVLPTAGNEHLTEVLETDRSSERDGTSYDEGLGVGQCPLREPQAPCPNGQGNGVAELTYSRYLRLPELLDLQEPLSADGSPRQEVAEHFFIVTHQASELWLRQALLDLEAAVEALSPERLELELALEHLERVAQIAQLLVEHVAMLGKLPLSCFAAFRQLLGTASGAQSSQFHALERVVGLRGNASPVYEAFLAAVDACGLSVEQVYHDDLGAGALYRIAEALVDIAQRLSRWQVVHLEIVSRLLGDMPGTGRTSGVKYLVDRMSTAFPELAEARTVMHGAREAVPG
jgi:tryptophan 2,3-dioxygenase